MTSDSDLAAPASPASPAARSIGAPAARKLAAQVAGRIEADILAAGWPVGTVFGSETELRERYGVSRAVLREAIRLVEHHEVATMRRGPNGGLVIRAPEAGPLTAALVIYLEHVGTTVEDLLAVRLLLEPLAARRAAERMTEDGIQTLRDVLHREESYTGDWDLDLAHLLHNTVGRLSGNAALRLFIDVLADLTDRYAQTPQRPKRTPASAVQQASLHAHRAIADAIIAGDGGLAEHRTIRHLEALREWLLSRRQQPIDRTTRPENNGNGNGSQKLAETVARRMMADIADSGAGVGEVVGSEPELLQRLGVSRAVFREAVRLLEYHSVAYMRRGPGGGLIVAEPDAMASVEAMAIHLDYEKIRLDDLREVRDVIELGSLELVTARHDDPAVAERLREAVRTEGFAPSETVGGRAQHVHTEIAELSGNPVLALFARIVTTVWARHSAQMDDERPDSQEKADVVARAHQAIVDAILAGDLPLARHRMRRHLEALIPWWQ